MVGEGATPIIVIGADGGGSEWSTTPLARSEFI
jgi:hypothetical protein